MITMMISVVEDRKKLEKQKLNLGQIPWKAYITSTFRYLIEVRMRPLNYKFL